MKKWADKVSQQRGSGQNVASGDEAFTAARVRRGRGGSIENTRTRMHTLALVF